VPIAHLAVRPKRSLGQNFLVDDNIARKIVASLHLQKDDVLLEIGPGHGALTKYLAQSVRHLIAVEIDGRVVDTLRTTYGSSSATILHQDFLETDIHSFARKFRTRIRVVGNIPYQLTSPILFKIFDEHRSVCDVTMMVQREVARRIVAKPGTRNCGILSVMSQFYGTPKVLFTVSSNCFYPKPNVTSTVLQMKLFQKPQSPVDVELLRTVVRTAFGKRRKTLRNSLKFLPFDKDIVAKVFPGITIPLNRRAEELTIDHWINLTNEIGACLS